MLFESAIASQQPITPLQIFGGSSVCRLWLNTKRSTITESGGVVSQINDLSGNDINFEQPTLGNRPSLASLGGKFTQVLEFDGNDDFLQDASGSLSYFNFLHATTGTVFAVWYVIPLNPNNIQTLCSDFNGSPNIGCNFAFDDRSSLSLNNTIRSVTSNGSGIVVNSVNPNNIFPTQQWNLTYFLIDNANATASLRSTNYNNNYLIDYQNNSSTGTPSASNYTRSMKIGCRGDATLNFANIYLSELVIANVQASNYQRALLKRWAQSEWGIVV